MLRVVIADDHDLVRQGLRTVLERVSEIAVVGEAANGDEAVELVARFHPDVLVTDLAMPGFGGLYAAEQLRVLGLPTAVVVVSIHRDAAHVRQALLAGARGFVPKDQSADELVQAVRVMAQGGTFLSPSFSGEVLRQIMSAPGLESAGGASEALTPRERQTLRLIAAGHTSKDTARVLGISVKTVERHRVSLMAKLDVHGIADLVQTALRQGLVLPEE
ncbi:MAG: response regulator [Chloroflexota bacterium]